MATSGQEARTSAQLSAWRCCERAPQSDRVSSIIALTVATRARPFDRMYTLIAVLYWLRSGTCRGSVCEEGAWGAQDFMKKRFRRRREDRQVSNGNTRRDPETPCCETAAGARTTLCARLPEQRPRAACDGGRSVHAAMDNQCNEREGLDVDGSGRR